ncbi:MAG: hypothetical protein L0221_06540 [Chloroflexi bacterium]|nr:hypothetical protein [Chloroflexota bacterium]
MDGDVFTLVDGDAVSFGGSGGPVDLWIATFDWVRAPDPSCPNDEGWFLNDVVIPQRNEGGIRFITTTV